MEDEIELVYNLLLHPAGYAVDIDGIMCVRKYEYPMWVVEWEYYDDAHKREVSVKEFNNAKERLNSLLKKDMN